MANTELESQGIDPSEDPLWARIEAYEFDALDPDQPFAARLARENVWTVDYAERVIEEYRRFCYLAVRAEHPVVPSDQVDRVWHLHIGYSRSYWQEFCARVLEFDLHHEPACSGGEAAERCRNAYAATLAAYERVSGEDPPADIWPAVEARFGRSGTARRVSTDEYLIIRRPSKGMLWAVQVSLVLAALFFLWQGKLATALVIGIAAAALSVYRDRTDNAWKVHPWRDGEDGGLGTGGCFGRNRRDVGGGSDQR